MSREKFHPKLLFGTPFLLIFTKISILHFYSVCTPFLLIFEKFPLNAFYTLIQDYIIRNSRVPFEVLGLEIGAISGARIILEANDDEKIDSQMWFRGKTDAHGWFTIRHYESGLFMTKKEDGDITIEGIFLLHLALSKNTGADQKLTKQISPIKNKLLMLTHFCLLFFA